METDLHSKSRNELREALRRKGLSPSGVKEDLIKRLEGFGGSIQSNSFISSGLNSNAFVLSTRKQMDANESHRSTDDEQPSPQPHHLQSTQQSIQQQQQPVNNVLQTQLLVAEQSAINHQEQLINATRAILSDESPICGHPNKYGKPCQRVGRYCPYHGVIKGALERQQHQNEYSSNNAATSRFKEFTKHVVEADPTYIPASVSALPTTIEYSHTSASVIGKRKVDNYSTIVDTLINRPTKRFKHVDLSAEDIARQRFFQHAALEFERIREDQQHQLELQQLQHQIEAMREKAQQKDKVIESLERTISEMDRNLLSNPDKVSSDDISRWKLSTQKIYDDQLKNIF